MWFLVFVFAHNWMQRVHCKWFHLTREPFDALFGVSLGTVRNWEQGRRHPEGPARALLAVINKAPKAVMDALGVGRRGNKAA